eukprot:TRINITY_DN24059_c0_g1_i1.p1 TRINITY_DN24059_c0_g1~~TRINITY_DN24059_c0_g1_i1.p1  ORF type:complete len:259 (+),score=56.61 TRINITY_DN24059_c0_g1_i1:90-866(+)
MLSRIWGFITRKRHAGDDAEGNKPTGSPYEPSRKRQTLARPGAGPAKEFKIVLLGDAGVGKTTFVKRHLTGEFLKRYEPTQGCEMQKLRVTTSSGLVIFHFWDTAGREEYGGLRDGYYIGANGAIVFFDVSNRESMASVQHWLQAFRKVAGDAPVVVLGNKVDVGNRAVRPQEGSAIVRKHRVQYYDVSAKSRFNLEMPLLWLARKLLQEPQLQLAAEVAATPSLPSAFTTSAERYRASRELAEAASVKIASDSDDDL